MKTLSVFPIFVAICQIVAKTKSQQCPAFESEESILGWMLQGHIYQTMMANIGLHCLSACLKDDRCQSFNFVMSLHMCEFSDRTKEARPEDFIPDADRYYFRKYMNRAPVGSISELAAESCKEIRMSEGRSPNGKYWMSSIKPGIPVLAFCDMKTEDVDECTASSPVCHVNATCNNTVGSYRCTCYPGYAGDGKTCRDFNECSSPHSPCHVNAKCKNTEGSYVCTCKAGYTGNGKTCTATCPTGFVMHRKSCYYISPTVTATFSDARRRCKSLGADLAMIKSANENNFLYNLVKISAAPKPAWIGLKRKADNKFYWLDNTPVQGNYQRWKDGEPNDSGGNEDCGHMLTHKNGPWNDASCSASGLVALCQKPL
ncbi:versican core protein-like isoform X1 [Montipora capricornis]|uniref:versican core protein-like isoform X1 n=1 Tax=Montipora capricornis TaxID=246305 RepID=UPI0035F1037D